MRAYPKSRKESNRRKLYAAVKTPRVSGRTRKSVNERQFSRNHCFVFATSGLLPPVGVDNK